MRAFKCGHCRSIFFDAEYIGVLYIGKGKISIDNGIILTSSFDVIERVEHTQEVVCPYCSRQINIDRIPTVDVDDLMFDECQSMALNIIDWSEPISLNTTPDRAQKLNEIIKRLVVTI